MPEDYWNEPDWESHNTKNWDDAPAHLYDDLMHNHPDGWEDQFGKMLFDIAFINPDESPDVNATARDMFREWLQDEYNIDLDSEFDWDAWREWYSSG